MAMTRNEVFAKMMSGEISGQSKLGMRSESIQHKYSARRLPKLEKKLKKKSKLLIAAELAVPFNPETGVADEKYNPTTKYRPALSATTTALYLKSMADSNAVCKEAFMKRAGVGEWDTSDADTLTSEDRKIFGKYRTARIFTVPVVSVNIPKMTNRKYAKDYAIYVDRNDKGEIIGDTPMALKVNKLFRDVCYEKINDFQAQCDSGELQLTQEQITDRKGKFRKEIAVSDDHPSNWVQIVELPMTSKYEVSADVDLKEISADVLDDMTVIAKMTSSLGKCIESYTRGDYEMFDHYFDFYEVDMSCPVSGADDPMIIGKDTTIDSPKISLTAHAATAPFVPKLEQAFSEYMDADQDIEQVVRRSTYIADYTEEVAGQILGTLHTVLDVVDNPFVTQKVVQANAEVIMLAYGDEGAALVEDVDAEVSDKEEGTLDSATTDSGKAQYDLTSAAFSADESLEDMELAEVDPMSSPAFAIS